MLDHLPSRGCGSRLGLLGGGLGGGLQDDLGAGQVGRGDPVGDRRGHRYGLWGHSGDIGIGPLRLGPPLFLRRFRHGRASRKPTRSILPERDHLPLPHLAGRGCGCVSRYRHPQGPRRGCHRPESSRNRPE
ncbi:MAG: hypothetical protein ACK55Z_11040, partial [bacterium]